MDKDFSVLDELLTKALNVQSPQKFEAFNSLAKTLAEFDIVTISTYAERVSNTSSLTVNDFKKMVKSHQDANGKASRKPTDDELADRWIESYPLTAYGLGEFRRYKNGIWPILSLDTIRVKYTIPAHYLAYQEC